MGQETLLLAAEAERDRLEAELRNSPIYKRLQSVKALIAAYRSSGVPQRVANGPLPIRKLSTTPPGNGTKTARVLEGAVKVLSTHKSRATSGEIAKALASYGIQIDGKLLSSYLANAKELFDNKPNEGGYGLTAWYKAEAAE